MKDLIFNTCLIAMLVLLWITDDKSDEEGKEV